MSDPVGQQPPPHDPAAVREATDALLAERHFRDGMNISRDEEVGRVLDVLWARIVALVDGLIHLQETNPVLYWLLLVGLAAVAAAMVWHITYSVRRSSRQVGARRGVVGVVVGEANLGSLEQQYRDAARGGELSQALCLLFAIVVAERIGLVRLRALGHLTYRELLRMVARTEPVAGLEAVVGVIEETLYAGRELDAATFSRCVDGVERRRSP